MDLNSEHKQFVNNLEDIKKNLFKRKIDETKESNKKLKFNELVKTHANIINQPAEAKTEPNLKQSPGKNKPNTEKPSLETLTKVPISPRKRLEVSPSTSALKPKKENFIYGNYSQYYGYRNKGKDNHDIRLDVLTKYSDIFKDKHILDIGCNSGFITMEVANKYNVKSIVGLDIDKSLINQAIKRLIKMKKSLPMDNEQKRLHKYPFNISFIQGNYVLKDDVLLEIERSQFDVILCLSITKWIHLNFGDKGLKQAFKRMFLQLKPQGKLILEAQPYDNYGRRKKMTDTIYNNYKDIKLLPKDFTEYLLSDEVGFSKAELMGVPDHCAEGFKRPIQILFKN